MKRHYKKILAVVLISLSLLAFNIIGNRNSVDPDKDKFILELLTFVIKQAHYSPANIDDNYSKKVYKNYIEALDGSKRFFMQSDIDEFAKYEKELDNQLLEKKIDLFELTYSRINKRMGEKRDIYKKILSEPFDFTVDEDFSTDFEKHEYAKTDAEIYDRWRRQLKFSVLSMVLDKQSVKTDSIDGKPKPKKAEDNSKKSFKELEAEARESTLKSLDESISFMEKELVRDDWFSIYINCYMTNFDPHTSYFPADDKERFDVSISGNFEGIGARLHKKNDYIEIDELISGGPAWKGKELEVGDLILKVAEGKEKYVDVVGMRLDNVVKKIKGPKGTEVRLMVKKVDGTIKEISMIRDIVEIEETYVKSSIVEKDGVKYGVIYLPKFYINFENKQDRDAGKDVKKEVENLKKENVQGIVMDVRNNGGGSLSTVVDIAGLFIKKGPIVQVQTSGKDQEILSDKDSSIEWDGPLVILVNNFSASASEILAAAMQDYKRGIVLGSKQTYGKGTVQNLIDLNQFVKNNSIGDLGALKTTTQKFYRITGGSTQLKGVASDVVVPDKYSYLDIGERDEESVLPWDHIKAADFEEWNAVGKKKANKSKGNERFLMAIQKSNKRVAENVQFKLIDENAKWIASKKDDNVYSLKLDKFKAAQEETERISKKYKAIRDYKTNLVYVSPPYELNSLNKDESLKEKREIWHKDLQKDAYVEEALNILDDLQDNSSLAKK